MNREKKVFYNYINSEVQVQGFQISVFKVL